MVTWTLSFDFDVDIDVFLNEFSDTFYFSAHSTTESKAYKIEWFPSNGLPEGDGITEIINIAWANAVLTDVFVISGVYYLLAAVDAEVAPFRKTWIVIKDDLGTEWNNDMGFNTGITWSISYTITVGTNIYFLFNWSNENAELWKWDSITHGFSEIKDCGAGTSVPTDNDQKGISYDDSDLLYFILVIGGVKTLYTYSISSDLLTQGPEYDISLMLERNSNSNNEIPFNLEKGFDVALDANNLVRMYTISKSRGNIYAISELGLSTGDLIIAITDTYLIVDKTGSGGNVELWGYVDFINVIKRCIIKPIERNYWKCTMYINTEHKTYTIRIFDGMFIQIIESLSSDSNTGILAYYNAPDNFNDETAGAITVAGDMAWLDTLTLPDTCTAALGTVNNHKNVLGISHAGVGDPIAIHQFTAQETSGTYEWWWGSSDVTRNQTIRFRGTGIAVYLRINTSKFTYLDSIDAEIEIVGATPTNDILDHFRLVFNCTTDTFDLYINGTIRVTGGEFNNPDTYIDELYMASITNAAYTQYIDAPGNVSNSNYYTGKNRIKTKENAIIHEGYARFDTLDNPRKVIVDSPAIWDLKNKTVAGTYSGRTDEILVSLLEANSNYIVEGTLANGTAMGDNELRGAKTFKNIASNYAQTDAFSYVIKPDNGRGLFNYNDASIESHVTISEDDKIIWGKAKKVRANVNQVNLRGGYNVATGKPFKSTKNNLASQKLYGVQPIFRTFAEINTQAKLDILAQSILDTQELNPYEYTFVKKVDVEGLVLPTETVLFSYTPEGITSLQRIITKLEYYAVRRQVKWTIADAIKFTTERELTEKDIQENTDHIEQLADIIYNISGGYTLYLHAHAPVPAVGTYLTMCTDDPDAVKTDVCGVAITAADQAIEQFITPVGCPDVILLQKGVYDLHLHAEITAGTKDCIIYFEFYKRILAGTETLLGTSQDSDLIAGTETEYSLHMLLDEIALLSTDRLVLKLYATPSGVGSNPTLSIYIEGLGVNQTLSRLTVPISIGDIGGAIPTITEDTGAPVITPDAVGDVYLDTDLYKLYMATHTNNAGAWAFIGKGQATVFDKDTVADLIAWYDAAEGVTKDGGDNVTAWTDQSDGGNHLTLTPATKPVWYDAVIGVHPAIHGNGNTYLYKNTVDIGGVLTIFIVCEPTILDAGVYDMMISFDHGGSHFIGKNTGTVAFMQRLTTDVVGENLVVDQPDIRTVVSTPGAGLSSVALNDNAPNTGTTTDVVQDIIMLFNYHITNNTWAYKGYIAEVLIYDVVLSEANQDIVRNYLNNKYAIW